MRKRSAFLVVAIGILPLAACTGSPTVGPSPTASGPPSFPRVAGTVVSRTEPHPDDWLLSVRVTDTAAAYREARALLVQAGYQITNDAPATDGGNGQACTTRLCVSFTALTHPGAAPTVEYEVFHSTGLVG